MRRRKANTVAPADDGTSDDIESKFDINLEWKDIMRGDLHGQTSKPSSLQDRPDKPTLSLQSKDVDDPLFNNQVMRNFSESPRVGVVNNPRKINTSSSSVIELNRDEMVALSVEMRELFAEIKKHVLEYKGNHETLSHAVKEADVSKLDMETKIEELELENSQLQLALTKGLENRTNAQNRHIAGAEKSAAPDAIIGASQGGDDIRRVLLDHDDAQVLEESSSGVDKVFDFRRKVIRYIERHTPFEMENRKLHATFGGAVAAYFLFLRWMYMNFLLVGMIAVAIGVIHIINMIVNEQSGDILTGGNVLPGFMLISTFLPAERVLYATTVIVMILVLCVIGLLKLIAEDVNKKRYEITESGKEAVYSKLLLVGWDNAISSQIEAVQYSSSVAGNGRELLAATQSKGEQQARTNLDTAKLIVRRILGFSLYGAMQFACYVLIAYLTVESHAIQEKANDIGFLKFFAPSIVPAVVTAINSTTPSIIKVITLFEMWESGQTEVNLRILRMFLSRILNILVLAIAYGFLADPFMMADEDSEEIRRKVEIQFSDGFKCRLNQTGDGMMSLVFTDLVISMLVLYGIGIGSKLIAKILGEPWVKYEFDTASTMVSVLYFAGLIVLTLPFSPLSLVFAPVMFALRFKWEAWVSSTFSSKPKKPWQVHAAGRTFTIFYLFTLVFVGVSSAFFFLGVDTFAKSCRIQDENVKLCLGDVDLTTDLCDLDPTSEYYSLYSDSDYCEGGYPYCICHGELACGPFVNEDIALNPFSKRVRQIPGLGFFWDNLILNSYGTWLLVGILVIMVNFRYNSFRVTKTAKKEKEAQYIAHISSLQAEQKRQLKIINRLRILEGGHGAVVDNN